jgi:hypothetical protein
MARKEGTDVTSSDAESPVAAAAPVEAAMPVEIDAVESIPADDDDFTDIELAELDSAEEPGASDGRMDDGRLREAHDRAAQLRGLANELDRLDEAPMAEHVDFYQRTHTALQAALSDIDNA